MITCRWDFERPGRDPIFSHHSIEIRRFRQTTAPGPPLDSSRVLYGVETLRGGIEGSLDVARVELAHACLNAGAV